MRKYHPELTQFLGADRLAHGGDARGRSATIWADDLQVVFIGPCIAKKGEASIDTTHVEIDAVLTFAELREMFEQAEIVAGAVDPDDDFDPPYGGVGAVFPISGGLLQTAGLQQDLLSGEIVVAEGRDEFVDAIKEFDVAHEDARLWTCCRARVASQA